MKGTYLFELILTLIGLILMFVSPYVSGAYGVVLLISSLFQPNNFLRRQSSFLILLLSILEYLFYAFFY